MNLIETWSGTPPSWKITPSPKWVTPPALTGVSCTAKAFCVAVGSHYIGVGGKRHAVPAFETWRGKAWVRTKPAQTFVDGDYYLSDVSCTSTRFCLAVGNGYKDTTSENVTLIERFDGATWRVMPGPNAASLTGVSCVSSTDCFAVG